MDLIVSATELIEHPRNLRPHAVLLGAGASRAAFPSGDAGGRQLPVMSDLVDVVGFTSIENTPFLVVSALGVANSRSSSISPFAFGKTMLPS